MKLEKFLNTLFNNFNTFSIDYCILRNYETLPMVLKKGDIDVLVSKENLTNINEIIENIRDIYVIGITKRSYVHNYFLYNIDKGGNSRALQIDFIFEYTYKGINYMDIPYLLTNSRLIKDNSFYIPNNFDELFLVFFPYYLSNGEVNTRYEDDIVSVFKNNYGDFNLMLNKIGFDNKIIDEIYFSIIQNKTQSHILSAKVKLKIFLNNFNLIKIIKHFLIEIKIRIPLLNSSIYKVNLNPKNKILLFDNLESFAKNIVLINVKSYLDFLRLFKIQRNFTMYIFYNSDSSKSLEETLSEITISMQLKK
jgi:hypothetical protein